MNHNRIYTLVTVPFIVYICAVCFFCLYHFSGEDLNLSEYIWGIRKDRIAHFLMFLPYPFVCWLFFNYNKHIKIYKQYTFATILLSGIALGAITEAAQEMFTSYRDGDPYDLGADITGIVVGTVLVYLLRGLLSYFINAILGIRQEG